MRGKSDAKSWAAQVQYESVVAHGLALRGAQVSFLTCGGGLEICDRANTYEAPPMPCRTCTRYTSASLEAHAMTVHRSQGSQFDRVSLVLPPLGPVTATSPRVPPPGVLEAVHAGLRHSSLQYVPGSEG